MIIKLIEATFTNMKCRVFHEGNLTDVFEIRMEVVTFMILTEYRQDYEDNINYHEKLISVDFDRTAWWFIYFTDDTTPPYMNLGAR